MAQYKTGTVATAAGSQTITGTGTAWLADISAGDRIQIDPDKSFLEILTVDSDTQLTLAVNIPDTRSGASYTIQTDFTATVGLPLINQGDLHAADIISRAFNMIDAALNGGMAWVGSVLDKDLTAPPGGEGDGDAYIVAATATGDWAGFEDYIATYDTGESQYDFVLPDSGSFVLVVDELKLYIYDSTAGWLEWTLQTSSTVANVASDEKFYLDGGTDTWIQHVSATNTIQVGIDDAVVFIIGK